MRGLICGLITLAAVSAVPVQAADPTVEMLNTSDEGTMVFSPGYLKIEPGETITFRPTDASHNSQSVLVPEGGPSGRARSTRR